MLKPLKFDLNGNELVTLDRPLSSNKASENVKKQQLFMEVLTMDPDLDLVALRVWKLPGGLSFS